MFKLNPKIKISDETAAGNTKKTLSFQMRSDSFSKIQTELSQHKQRFQQQQYLSPTSASISPAKSGINNNNNYNNNSNNRHNSINSANSSGNTSNNSNIGNNGNTAGSSKLGKTLLSASGITNSIPIVLCGFLQGDIFGSNYSLPTCSNNGELQYDPAHYMETGSNTNGSA